MKKTYLVLLGLITLHLFFLINLKFTAWPEMLSYPYLRNNDYLLYKDMIHPYPPILTMVLSWVFKFFGYKEMILKIFTWLIIISNDLFIFAILNKLTKQLKISLVGVLAYILTQPFLEGNQLWFDLAIVPFVLLGIFCFLKDHKKTNLFASGLFLGVALFIKQTTGLFLVLGIFYLLAKKVSLKNIVYFCLGPLLIFLVLGIRLITENALGDFFKWIFINPIFSWSRFPGYVQMSISKYYIFVLVILVLPLFFFLLKSKLKLFRDGNFLILFFSLMISAVLVYPRFSFFHLQLFLAIVPIITFYLLTKTKINKLIIFGTLLLMFIFIDLPYIKKEWGKPTRFWDSEELSLSEKILEKTSDSKNIYLLGLSSAQYVFSKKVPPKRWGDNFGWYYINQKDEYEMIERWNMNKPDYVISKNPEGGNWYELGTFRSTKVLSWLNENYKQKEKIAEDIWLWERVN